MPQGVEWEVFTEQEMHRPLSAAVAATAMEAAEVRVVESTAPTESVHRSFNMSQEL